MPHVWVNRDEFQRIECRMVTHLENGLADRYAGAGGGINPHTMWVKREDERRYSPTSGVPWSTECLSTAYLTKSARRCRLSLFIRLTR